MGDLDLQGLRMKGLTMSVLEAAEGWGKPHSQRSTVLFYLRDYVDMLPDDPDPASLTWNARRQHAASSVSFEFTARPDRSILKVRIKHC